MPQVQCDTSKVPGLAPGSCQPVLDSMPVDLEERVFGSKKTQGVDVVVPEIFDAKRKHAYPIVGCQFSTFFAR